MMVAELTEEEKARIKKRLDRHSPKWSFDRLHDTYTLINDIRARRKAEEDWFIPNLLTNRDILEELYLSNFIT